MVFRYIEINRLFAIHKHANSVKFRNIGNIIVIQNGVLKVRMMTQGWKVCKFL